MGLFTDHYQAAHEGHDIEVEARVISLLGTIQYDLVVDDRRIDRLEGTLGRFTLRGQTGDTEKKEVRVEVRQRLFGTSYQLFVAGDLVPLQKM